MVRYIKPNGTEVDINESSIEYAESLGWKPVKTKKTVMKRKPKPKAD